MTCQQRSIRVTIFLVCSLVCTGGGISAWFSSEARAQNSPETLPVKQYPEDYRHIHMDQVQACIAGEFEKVIPACEKLLAEYPTDGEALFFLAVAQAQLDEHQAALATIGKAIAANVAGERFFAGPRTWTKPFAELPEYQLLRDKYSRGLLHGPMLGKVTPTGASVWVRTFREIPVEVLVSDSPEMTKIIHRAIAVTSMASDYTAVIRLTGLSPKKQYYYQVRVAGNIAPNAQAIPFSTAPSQGKGTKFRFVFGGGAAYTPKYAHMWNTIDRYDPDMFLFMGDNVYIDNPTLPDYQRYLYYRRQSQRDYRHMLTGLAAYAIWDDHDFGVNDCHGGPLLDLPAWKRPVWNIFRQNWINPGYGAGETNPGCWFDFVRGDVHFIMLDGRYYRTLPSKQKTDGAPSMLGPVQKQWLLDTLKNSSAKIIFIASPVPWVGGNQDKWAGFPEEREEILSFLEQHHISGVVLLSADRHRSDLLITRRSAGHDLYELMSSRLTNVHTHALATQADGALFSYNKTCSFGMVDVDTTTSPPSVIYRIITIDGDEVFSTRLSARELGL